jgi:hypothetical protein
MAAAQVKTRSVCIVRFMSLPIEWLKFSVLLFPEPPHAGNGFGRFRFAGNFSHPSRAPARQNRPRAAFAFGYG